MSTTAVRNTNVDQAQQQQPVPNTVQEQNATTERTSSAFSGFIGIAGTFLAVLGGLSLATDMGAREIVVLGASTAAGLVKPVSKLAMNWIITPGMNLASAAATKAMDFYNSGIISSTMKGFYNMIPSFTKSA